MQMINSWILGLQGSNISNPARSGLWWLFCGVNPRHGNTGRAMSTHSQAPDSKNTSCCPECHLTCSRRAKTQASRERKKETRRRFNGCFFGPCMVAAVIRTNSWQATITNPRSSYGCQNGGQSSATQLICRMRKKNKTLRQTLNGVPKKKTSLWWWKEKLPAMKFWVWQFFCTRLSHC